MTLHEQADGILQTIGATKDKIAEIEEGFERQWSELRARFQPQLDGLFSELGNREKELIALMKKNKGEFFKGKKDKVSLVHGLLLYTKEDRLSLPKDAVERIEEQGWLEVIKTVKSVDREKVEKWPLEKILAIGGDKKPKEKFDYEVRNADGKP